MRSPNLFARKFDPAKDPDIIPRLAQTNGYVMRLHIESSQSFSPMSVA
jgi:hypothetical protein